MPKDYPRSRRIAGEVQRELTEIIRLELKDPRVGMITITDVDVSPDQKLARVYFTSLAGASGAEEAGRGLRRAAGFLRTQLARRFQTRSVPQLEFIYDASVERGVRLSGLIDAAVAEDAQRAAAQRGRRRKRG